MFAVQAPPCISTPRPCSLACPAASTARKLLAVAAAGMCVLPHAAVATMVDAGVAMPATQILWLLGEPGDTF